MIDTIRFKKITIIVGVTESIHFEPDLPTPYPEMGYTASLKMEVRKGYGAEYVRKTFGREPDEVIFIRS